MRRLLIGSFAFAAAFTAAAVSQAHIDMIDPPPRHVGFDNQKTAPCGIAGSTRSGSPLTVAPGSQLTIKWDETVDHPGHYRILFDEDGTDFVVPANGADICTPGEIGDTGVHCLADNIPDQAGAPDYEMTVTLPDVVCDNCTIQLIQWMSDKENDGIPDNEVYFECTDVVLADGPVGQGGGGGGTTSGAGGAGGAGGSGEPTTSSSSSGSGAGSGAEPTDDDLVQPTDSSCGCRVVGMDSGASSAAAVAALGLVAFAARRRRSAR